MSTPLAHFLTFRTYGTWLQGQESGYVTDDHNRYGDPVLPAEPALESHNRGAMNEPPYHLDAPAARGAVLAAACEVCRFRGWFLHAAHVRTTHVHLVVSGDAAPEKMLTDFKAYATRRLKSVGDDPTRKHRWAHHGSTRYLWDDESVAGAIRYMLEGQGVAMATYRAGVGPSEPGARATGYSRARSSSGADLSRQPVARAPGSDGLPRRQPVAHAPGSDGLPRRPAPVRKLPGPARRGAAACPPVRSPASRPRTSTSPPSNAPS